MVLMACVAPCCCVVQMRGCQQISEAERSLAQQVSAHLTANSKVQRLRDEAETLRAELETLAAQLMQQDEISTCAALGTRMSCVLQAHVP